MFFVTNNSKLLIFFSEYVRISNVVPDAAFMKFDSRGSPSHLLFLHFLLCFFPLFPSLPLLPSLPFLLPTPRFRCLPCHIRKRRLRIGNTTNFPKWNCRFDNLLGCTNPDAFWFRYCQKWKSIRGRREKPRAWWRISVFLGGVTYWGIFLEESDLLKVSKYFLTRKV